MAGPSSRLGTRVSCLIGIDPDQWRFDVPVWSGVRYVDLYPELDLEITGGHAWSWRIVPTTQQTDIRVVRLRVVGADRLTLDGGADSAGRPALHIATALGSSWLPLLDVAAATCHPPLSAPQVTGRENRHPFCWGNAGQVRSEPPLWTAPARPAWRAGW